MHWVIQENLYNEIGFNALIGALETLGIPYSVHKIIPFVHQLEPEINPTGKVMVMGAYTMNKIAKDRGWKPGTYLNDAFDYKLQTEKWPGHMLNGDASFSTMKDAALNVPDEQAIFVRPVEDMKSFAGQVMSYKEFTDWQYEIVNAGLDSWYPLHADTEIMISLIKKIYTENRVWVVNNGKPNSVVTASTYRVGKVLHYSSLVDADILEFVEARNAEWRPDEAYVMDVARTPDGLKIVEINNINASGFYAGDVSKIVAALEELNS